MKIKETPGERTFNVFNIILMVFLMIIMFYPFWYVVVASFSVPNEFAAHSGPLLVPLGFQVEAYKVVFRNSDVLIGYANTIFYVVVGTTISVTLTIIMGYVLSRKQAMLKKPLMLMVVFTMFFSGGMIPTFLMMTDIGLNGTRGAIIFAGLIGTTNVIIMRTAFMGIPSELEESAKMDGANDIVVLSRILIPLAKPTISVLLLYYGVGRWNSWFDAMIYLRDRSKFPLQLYLREILVFSSTEDMMLMLGTYKGQDLSEIIKYATVIVSTLPILLIYPFLQKHFVKGVMIGAIKG